MQNEQFHQFQQKDMDASMQLAQLSIRTTLTIGAVLLELAHDLLQQGLATSHAEIGARDGRDVMNLRTEHVQRTVQAMTECARRIAEIGYETRAAFSRLLTEQLASGSLGLLDEFQTFFKVLPAQLPDSMESMRQAVDRTSDAFEQIALVTNSAVFSIATLEIDQCPKLLVAA